MDPIGERPHMPGYGIAGPTEGRGVLPWSWAEARLAASHDYWLATVRPDGRPHVMPVWGVWDGAALWFSSSARSRKARNLEADPRCSVTVDTAREPVIVEGEAHAQVDLAARTAFLDASNAKYDTSYTIEFLDPAVNATFRVDPHWVFALDDDSFADTPTCWPLVARA